MPERPSCIIKSVQAIFSHFVLREHIASVRGPKREQPQRCFGNTLQTQRQYKLCRQKLSLLEHKIGENNLLLKHLLLKSKIYKDSWDKVQRSWLQPLMIMKNPEKGRPVICPVHILYHFLPSLKRHKTNQGSLFVFTHDRAKMHSHHKKQGRLVHQLPTALSVQ